MIDVEGIDSALLAWEADRVARDLADPFQRHDVWIADERIPDGCVRCAAPVEGDLALCPGCRDGVIRFRIDFEGLLQIDNPYLPD